MKLRAYNKKYTLAFKKPAKTSRETMTTKDTWFLVIEDQDKGISGIGECSFIPGLSMDNPLVFQKRLDELCDLITEQNDLHDSLDFTNFPSIQMGIDTAIKDLHTGGQKLLFPGAFTSGTKKIPINGLVWMANFEDMKEQIKIKIDNGFDCIKIKVGAFDFKDELDFIKKVRKEYPDIILRLDANGAFPFEMALDYLSRLSDLNIHSIEQPIKAGNWEQMAEVCYKSAAPVALDEELIGVKVRDRNKMLNTISPHYLILKPSLLGGFAISKQWIDLAESREIGWWVTSALESNIGLNAIAQFTSTFKTELHQGLGTGVLYSNNITSPLVAEGGELGYDPGRSWNLDEITTK